MRKEFVIANEQGLHARPATTLVSKANQFKSSITIRYDGKEADLKSIMGVLSLGITRGELIEVIIEGDDEVDAMEAIQQHIKEMNMN